MPRGKRRRKIERWVKASLSHTEGQQTHTTAKTRPENVDDEVPAAHKHLRFRGLKDIVTKAKTTSSMSSQPSKHHRSLGAEEKLIHQTQDIRTLTTHPQLDTENVDDEVPAAHKHLRVGGLKEVVTKAKTTVQCRDNQASIRHVVKHMGSKYIRPRTSVR
jgi:hypothetical protein